MFNIVKIFLQSCLENFVSEGGFLDSNTNLMSATLVHNTLYIEDSAGLSSGITINFDSIINYITGFAVILIILKFMKKIFDTYVAWSDDPMTDPIVLITNLFKALVIAISFPILYSWLCEVIEDLTDGLLNVCGFANITAQDLADTWANLGSLTLGACVAWIIIDVLLVIMYFQLLVRGAELFVLRMGFPLACVGNIDANGGVFVGYVKKLFQAVLSITVMVALSKLSFSFAAGSHLIWAIVFAMTAVKAPSLLSEFIYTPQSSGGGMTKAYYGTQMIKGAMAMFGA